MGRVSDLAPDSQALQLWRQYLEHSNTGDERGGAQGNLEFIRGAIIVSDGLALTTWHLHRIQSGDLGRREIVQGGVDVPAVEASVAFRSVLGGYFGLMEPRVLRVLQLCFGETFVVVYSAVSDQLDLGNSRDRLQVRVKDRL